VAEWYAARGQIWNPTNRVIPSRSDVQVAVAGIDPTVPRALADIDRAAAEGHPWAAKVITEARGRNAHLSLLGSYKSQSRPVAFTPGQLLACGVPVEAIAAMPASTDVTLGESAGIIRRWDAEDRAAATQKVAEPIDIAAKIITPSQMSSMTPPRPLLGHLLYRDELSELIGESGSGKTFVALGLVLPLAAGRDFGEHRVRERTKVLYVAAETPRSVVLRSLGWMHQHGVARKEMDDWFLVYPEPLQLGDPEHMRELANYTNGKDFGLVAFDTRHLVTHGLDENSSTDQGVAIEACKALNRAGMATLVLHHTPKDGTVGGGGRGSGAWYASAYTSMYLTRKGDITRLVCDKNKDRDTSKCEHPLHYVPVTVPANWMPAGASEEERSTRVLTSVDPFSVDTGIGAHGLNTTQLSTLWVLATFSETEGLTATRLQALGAALDDHDIGKQATIYRSLAALGDHVKVVNPKPKTWRVSDTGWDLLVDEGLVEKDFADSHRYTVADLGSQPYLEAVDNIRAALDTLEGDGTIIRGTSTMTDCKKLVDSYMREKGQNFGSEAWSAAYPAWKDGTV